MKKKRYNITLTQNAADKCQGVLRKAGISLSSFLDLLVCQFSEIIDDASLEEKMGNMTISQCLETLSQIIGKIENISDKELEEKAKSMQIKSGKVPRKSVQKKES
jgi:hypothetical protein